MFNRKSYLAKNAYANPHDSIHRGGWRLAGFIAVLIWIGGIFFMSLVNYAPIPRFWVIFIVLSLGVFTGLFVRWWLFGMVDRKEAQHQAQSYQNMLSEQAKKIEEAKASGAFDRWKKES